ncbi:MAG: dipeptidase [Oscillospiraceae bacterium]
MNLPVCDLHCDTALELISPQKLQRFCRLARNEGHVDLERGGCLAAYAQFFAVFTTPDMDPNGVYGPEEIFSAVLHNLLAEIEENERIQLAGTPADAGRITQGGKIAAFLSLEGPAGIGFDPGRLEELAARGFRMTTLTWNEQNPLAGSHKTGGGLTARGRAFVEAAQRHGMAVDVSHLSDEAFWDIMDITQAPVSASHSNSRAVWPESRNLTDAQFRAICETGGVAGINLFTGFLGEEPVTLETVCRHVLHWLDMGGEKHIALGGDLDGCQRLPEGFTGVDCYPALARALAGHGVPRRTLEDIFWNNAMRMLERCSMSQP